MCVTIKINVMCECTSSLFNAPINGMLHLAYLAWGRCLRKEVDMQSESSPRGQYLVWIVLIHLWFHGIYTELMLATHLVFLIVTSVKMHDCVHSHSLFIVLNVFGSKFHKTPTSPCHTRYMIGRCGVCVRNM